MRDIHAVSQQNVYSANSQLVHAIEQHLEAFRTWQSKDLSHLGKALVDHYHRLLLLKQSVSTHQCTKGEWHPHINEQLEMIEARLQSLGDHRNLDACIKANQEFVKQQEEKENERQCARHSVRGIRRISDTAPPSSEGFDRHCKRIIGAECSAFQHPVQYHQNDDIKMSGSSTFPNTSISRDILSSKPIFFGDSIQENASSNRDNTRDNDSSSSTDYIQLVKQLATSWDADFLHQVCVNPSFQLESGRELRFYEDEPPPESDPHLNMADLSGENIASNWVNLHKRVDFMTRKALMDNVRQDLQANPPRTLVWKQLLSEFVERLCATTLPRQVKLRDTIREELNVENVTETFCNGITSIADIRGTIVYYMKMLAAPKRDDEIKKVESSKNTADLLFNSFAVIEAMQIDLANYVLESYRPLILKHGIEVERDRMRDLITSGAVGLENTRMWLGRTMRFAQDSAIEPYVSEKTSTLDTTKDAVDKMTFAELFFLATEAIVFSRELDNAFPETLLVDQQTLSKAREQLTAIAHVCALYILISHRVNRLKNNEKAANAFRDLMIPAFINQKWINGLNDDELRCIFCFSIFALNKGLDTPLSEEEVGSIRSIDFRSDAPVLSLLQKRVKEEYRRVIRSKSPVAVCLRLNNGLDLSINLLRENFIRLARIFDHNRQVYDFVYDDIIKTVLSAQSSS
eukprot:gene3665-8332_t